MAQLNKRNASILCAASVAAAGFAVFGYFLSPAYGKLNMEIKALDQANALDKTLIAGKSSVLKEWDSKKHFIAAGADSESLLSVWVKELLSMSQEQSIILEKLEPAGIKTGDHKKNLAVFLSFRGDVRVLAKFFFKLLEKDPLANIESLNMRRDENSQTYTFELMLAKVFYGD